MPDENAKQAPAPTATPTPIFKALEENNGRLNELSAMIVSLRSRLEDSVLAKNDGDKVSVSSPLLKSTSSSPLLDKIQDQCGTIMNLATALTDISIRLEV